jgi:hypothetical protein
MKAIVAGFVIVVLMLGLAWVGAFCLLAYLFDASGWQATIGGLVIVAALWFLDTYLERMPWR